MSELALNYVLNPPHSTMAGGSVIKEFDHQFVMKTRREPLAEETPASAAEEKHKPAAKDKITLPAENKPTTLFGNSVTTPAVAPGVNGEPKQNTIRTEAALVTITESSSQVVVVTETELKRMIPNHNWQLSTAPADLSHGMNEEDPTFQSPPPKEHAMGNHAVQIIPRHSIVAQYKTVEEVLPETQNEHQVSIDSSGNIEHSCVEAVYEKMGAANALLALSTAGVALPATTPIETAPEDDSQSKNPAVGGSDPWEETNSEEDVPLTKLHPVTNNILGAAPITPRLRPDQVTDDGGKKGVVPPREAVWSRGTMAAKSSRPRLWEWLELTGRDSSLPQYRGTVEELYVEVNKHMVEDKKQRKAAKQAKIAKAKQLVEAKQTKITLLQVPIMASPSETEQAPVRDKRKRSDGDNETDPEALSKKLRVANCPSTNSSEVEYPTDFESDDEVHHHTEAGILCETQGSFANAENDMDDEVQTFLSTGAEAARIRVATIRQDLEDVKKAALDSLQLRKSNNSRTQNMSFPKAHLPDYYSQYADRKPQLILQGDDGKPIFDYETQITVRRILKGRNDVLAKMQVGSSLKRDSPFKMALKEFKSNCRFVNNRVGKALKDDELDYKNVSKDLVNELFTQGIPGGEI